MGELNYLHFPLCLCCTPPDITEGGQERLFRSTRLGPGQEEASPVLRGAELSRSVVCPGVLSSSAGFARL